MALFMQSLDATILNTALPTIATDLQTPVFEMQMAIIAYSLAVALFIPLTAWAAAKFGTLTVFRSAVLPLYSVQSLVRWPLLSRDPCACTDSPRYWRCVYDAGCSPCDYSNRTENQLINAWNLMATAGLIGPILGPILGGWLVVHTSWHWIFLINIPIGMLGFWAAAKVMGNHKGNANKLDWTGFLLFAFGLVGLTLGLDLLGESHRDNMTTYSALSVGIALLVAYYFYAKGNERAILPLSLFNTRTFRLGIAANIFIRLSGSAVPFLLPLMFQLSFGYSAEESGWLLAPIALMSVVFKRFIGHILNMLGYKTTLILSSLLMAGSTISMSWLDTSSSTTWIICNLMWYGACMSMIFTSINTLTVGDLSQAQSGVGSTVLSIVQQVGIGFGIAVASIILTLYRQFMGNDGDALQHAFSYTFLTTSVLLLH